MGGFEGYDFEILIDLQKALFGKFSDIRNDWLRNEFNSFDEILEYAEEDPHLMARCNLVRQYRGKIVDMYIRIKKRKTSVQQMLMPYYQQHIKLKERNGDVYFYVMILLILSK